jgi:tryptophanyl-tRNA synthetase
MTSATGWGVRRVAGGGCEQDVDGRCVRSRAIAVTDTQATLMPRVFSGIQPSGDLHLGNYFGALINWVGMQETHDCVYCIVDMHAITVDHDATTLRERTVEMATNLLAVGVDPQRSTLFLQSHLGDIHAEATWLLNCVTGFGELRKQPQFKEKADRIEAGDLKGQVSVGLFDYPVLQTADIILYDADEVPVGEDQRHHIELARNLAQRFNHRFAPADDPLFVLPKAVHPQAAARVMDLQEPTNRMSKSSSSPKGVVGVLEDPKKIAKKIRSAMTDSEAEVRYDRENKPGVSNLLELYGAATGGLYGPAVRRVQGCCCRCRAGDCRADSGPSRCACIRPRRGDASARRGCGQGACRQRADLGTGQGARRVRRACLTGQRSLTGTRNLTGTRSRWLTS